jgi:RNA polymerase sigma-70 factor, ECF subfamily
MTPDLQTLSDEELARQTQAGSLVAFEELVHRYGPRIYGFVANACGNSADAREITQDTFVRAFQAISRFDSEREFAPWLFTLARRHGIDHHRRKLPAADEPMPERLDYDDPSELLAQREERRDLWQLARRRLPEAQFQSLWLRYAEEMSVVQIAQVLSKTQTHIKVLLYRARQTLAREITSSQTDRLQLEMVASRPSQPLSPAV